VTSLAALPGDPEAVRLLADRLTSTARRLAAIAGVLVRIRDGATWDGAAGEAFGARLHEVTPVLDAVAVRLGGAAPPLHRLAEAMEEAQHVVAGAVRDDLDAEHAYAVLEDRAYALVSAGGTEGSPEVLVVRHLQREQAEVRALAAGRHRAAAERFHEADRRCARLLSALSVDALTDSLPYRTVVGASALGHGLSSVGPVATAVPWLRPVAAVGDLTGLVADTGLLVAYGEGDAGALAVGAALAASGGTAGALRRGAVAGARQAPGGVVVTRQLTAQERLRLGALAEVRARRDELRRRFEVPPDRGTASALIGGPASTARDARSWSLRRGAGARAGAGGGAGARAGAGAGAGAGARAGAGAGGGASLRRSARAAVDVRILRARALASAKADAAFLRDWRLASANGLSAQRMYVAGTTLEVATTAGERAVASVPADRGAADTPQARAGTQSAGQPARSGSGPGARTSTP